MVIDTREQMPYEFPVPWMRATLPSGDYSIAGLEHQVAVERKRPQELFGNFGAHRDRFRREFERLASYRYAALVIEGDIASCSVVPDPRSSVSPAAVINSLIAWSIRYRVSVWFCGCRELAEATTFRILEKFFAFAVGYSAL